VINHCVWRASAIANANHIIHDVLDIESVDPLVAVKSKQKAKDWQAKVKGILKAELKRRNLSYADLADRLDAIGVKENERNISNKIGRGSFAAVFLIQCLEAIGCNTIQIQDT
jgi:hypothetical protein